MTPDAVRARRARRARSLDDLVRGADAATLAQPAGTLLAGLDWTGASVDPAALDAATFLARL